jgi:hypothetical protein
MQHIEREFPKWQKWADRIKEDVQTRLVNSRQIFRAFNETCRANSDHIIRHDGQFFCRAVQRWYVSHIAMAIRSHVKINGDSVSLMRLLKDIHECAAKFTFDFYLEKFPRDPDYVDWQTGTFSLFSEDGTTVSQRSVRKDMDHLRTLSSQVEDLADRAIAHLDKKPFDGIVTLGDLDACVDVFDKLVCKYLKLVTLSGYSTLEPTIPYDWTDIFLVPLDARKHSNWSIDSDSL